MASNVKVSSVGLTPSQQATIQSIVNSSPAAAQSYSNAYSGGSSGSVTAPSGSSTTNPHDAPGYNPALDPMSSAYNPNAKAAPSAPAVPTEQTPAKIDTAQPSPANVDATPFTKPSTQQLVDAYAANGPLTTQQITGATPIPSGVSTEASKYRTALSNLQSSSFKAPAEQAAGVAAAKAAIPAEEMPSPFDPVFQSDPVFTQLMNGFADFLSPQSQRESFVQEYERLTKESGVEQLNADLMNMKNVIDGTEDDIRSEITKAGGFATESQVLALSSSRNKVLIKNYNMLLDTVNQKKDYINNLMQLEAKDREAADAQFDRKFNISMQLMQYRDKMQDNARSAYQKIADTMGYDGLLSMAGNSPYYQGLIEKTIGVPAGGLSALAAQSAKDRAMQQQKDSLEMDILGLQKQKLANEVSGAGMYDPVELTAYAQQYASTGQIPTGVPKGSFGAVSMLAKQMPKPEGTVVDINTGIKPAKMSSAQADGIAALYDINKKIETLKTQLVDVQQGVPGGTGLVGGVLGKIPFFGADVQTRYEATRKEIVDLLARARTGAQINESEEKFYMSMLPSKWSNALYIGANPMTKIQSFETNMRSILDSKLKANGLAIYGYTKVKVGDQEYHVGDVVSNGEVTGRINPDGSITY